MENAQLIALSRQNVLRSQLDIVANNMANINTPGFKSQSLHFAEYIMPIADGTSFLPQDRQMSYVDMFTSRTNFEHGSINLTGNDLDLALNSDGFFVVRMPDGSEAYTRSGSFRLSSTGQLITVSGEPVMTDVGPMTFTKEDGLIGFQGDGTISTELGVRGKLRIVDFDDLRTLEKVGDTLFTGPNAKPAAEIRLVQGAVEASNVYGVTEVTRLIEISRAYDSTAKVMKETDELRQRAISTLGRLEA